MPPNAAPARDVGTPREIAVAQAPISRFEALLNGKQMAGVYRAAEEARAVLEGRTVWSINSTASGGGVAEMLRGLLPYVRDCGIDARWLVLQGDEPFFRLTKRLHHALHGSPGDGSPLGDVQRRLYEATLAANTDGLCALVGPRDAVILHDPQTAGLIPPLRRRGATVIWRCHIGTDLANEESEAGWQFIAPYIADADVSVFSRSQHIPKICLSARTAIIPPSIDPFSAKNGDLPDGSVHGILVHTGIIEGPNGSTTFLRPDGSAAQVDRQADVIRLGRAPLWDTPLVVQVSRWDPLKDHAGVMNGFVQLIQQSAVQADLVLAGPNVHGVADDPEQAEVLDGLIDAWRRLPHADRSRVHLACLPTADVEENAAIVNAIQRHAAIVVQKSLAEGFGLTVTEAMWKRRPVVASAVGGIADQIEDGVSGLLLKDPHDLAGLARTLDRLLRDQSLSSRLGDAAHERVGSEYLAVRELLQYERLVTELFS